ncbi:MAG TPA: hypothetical protein VK666_05620 [Chryseolinea sp.]|nr:hypothetical protein [Chryseolinea sp.]
MKPILLLLFVCPLFVRAQDCKLLRDTDPYTKETKVSTGFITLQGATLTIDADSKEIDFFFVVNDKCFNDASSVYIFFEGSKIKTTYRNGGSMNCDGDFHFKFRNTETPNYILQKLATLKVAQFIFIGSDKKEITVSLLPEQQKIFTDAATCIISGAKALIK